MPVLLKFYVNFVNRHGDDDNSFAWTRTAAEALEVVRRRPELRGGCRFTVHKLPGAILFPGGALHLLATEAEQREALVFMDPVMKSRGDTCLATPRARKPQYASSDESESVS